MSHKVFLQNISINVDLENDYYGAEFWNKISSRTYEPDTIGFLEDNCDERTDFLDIGTANGAMSLIAAASGATVFGYEPDPLIYKVATKNFQLNPLLHRKINLKNIALSSGSGSTKFGSGEFSDVLSSIVIAGSVKNPVQEIAIVALFNELDHVHTDRARKLVVKMDIEGAEWKIFQSEECLNALKNHSAKVLLAIHPGFYRPFKHFRFSPNRIRYVYWQLKNFRESMYTFRKIQEVARVFRTNLSPVVKPRTFALLVLAGYHEFIVDFA